MMSIIIGQRNLREGSNNLLSFNQLYTLKFFAYYIGQEALRKRTFGISLPDKAPKNAIKTESITRCRQLPKKLLTLRMPAENAETRNSETLLAHPKPLGTPETFGLQGG